VVVVTVVGGHVSCKKPEPVRTELVRQQKQSGLTLASYYRGVETIAFADRSLSKGSELQSGRGAGEGAISRDGTQIALDIDSLGHASALAIVRSDGSGLREYPEITASYGMCWSYDKSKLAMSVQNLKRGTTPPNDSLIVFDVASRARQDVDTRAYVTSQCWSPDNKQIAYEAEDSVRVYNIEQKTWQVLARGHDATWSSDGNWIAFRDNDTYYAIRPSGEERKVLFKTRGAISGLWWSPDSRIVAYVSYASFLEGSWMGLDVGLARLRTRRLEDGAEDWVAGLSDAHVPSYQWIEAPEPNKR
jgi:Tol biopolymer transport system component